jgi:ribose transport system permease protein
LTRENLLNVVNQNADIAMIAIGMTMVIITAGIDLSVGSLLALSGVITAVCVQQWAGGAGAGTAGIVGSCLLGLGTCALCGVFSGVMVTVFRVPAFVVTLGMMMVARGLALIIAVRYQSALAGGTTEGTPEAVKIQAPSFDWLGNGSLYGIPNPILLMILLYVAAHIVMTRTSVGRYIYAVGGNPEAARLSGVPVFGVLILVYALCGAMAGLGGVVDASRFEGGRPNAGELYELQVIAAVVVGGTSLAGGEGRVFGTLIGALIIAVIQNGLNMAGVKSYEQKVVFGLLILAAVLLDQLKKRQWSAAPTPSS